MEGLVGIHQMLGGLVVAAFIVVVILAAIAASGGSARWLRTASFIAAGLLVLQYIVGFALLGGGSRNTNSHYLIALLTIIPVAVQQSATKRLADRTRGTTVLIATLAAALLAVFAYLSGETGLLGG